MKCNICYKLLSPKQIKEKNITCSRTCSDRARSLRMKGTHPKSTQKQCHLCQMVFWVENWNKKNRKYCSMRCSQLNQTGKKGKILGKRFSMMREKNPNWRGGASLLHSKIRNCFEYQAWRRQVFERDTYTCQDCGDKKGGNLEVDHIIPFAIILAKNNIATIEEALVCIELWDTNNGRTLCTKCHKKTPTWGKRTFSILQKEYPFVTL